VPELGEYYDVAIDQPNPVTPQEPGPQPAEPVLLAEPAAAAEPNNLLALRACLAELDTYNEEVSRFQAVYKADLEAWQDEQEN
jgi:hypothetical protein